MSLVTVVNPIALSDYLTKLKLDLSTTLGELKTLETVVENLELEGVTYDDGELRTRIEALELDVSLIQAQITSITNVNNQQSTDITTNAGAISSAQSAITTLQSNTSALNSSISALQANTASLQSSVTALQGNTSSLSSSITALQANTSSLQSSVTSLQSSTTSLQNSINSLSTSITAVQQAAASWNQIALEPIDNIITSHGYERDAVTADVLTQLCPGGTKNFPPHAIPGNSTNTFSGGVDFSQSDDLNLQSAVSAVIQVTCLMTVSHNHSLGTTPIEWILKLRRLRSAVYTDLKTVQMRTVNGDGSNSTVLIATDTTQNADIYSIWIQHPTALGVTDFDVHSYTLFVRRLT